MRKQFAGHARAPLAPRPPRPGERPALRPGPPADAAGDQHQRHGDLRGRRARRHGGCVHRRLPQLPQDHGRPVQLRPVPTAVAPPTVHGVVVVHDRGTERSLRVGGGGVEAAGVPGRGESAGGRVLPGPGQPPATGGRCRERPPQGHRLRDRFRQHASGLYLHPTVSVKRRLALPFPLPLPLPLLAALLAVPELTAQRSAVVYGSIPDSGGQPLRATVTDIGSGLRSFADNQGRYRLSVAPGQTGARIGPIGYASVLDTLTLGAADSVERNYFLRPTAVELQPYIVVTAAKRSQLLDQAVTSVAVLEQPDIARRAITTVDEAVDKAPGVQFLNGQVNIRGSTGYVQGLGSRVLLLVDGVPANQGDRGGINWDLVPLDRVERVEVVKGAGSSLYGSAALGGVLNLISREVPLGLPARVRAPGSLFSNPPHDIWRFRDYTRARERVGVARSFR